MIGPPTLSRCDAQNHDQHGFQLCFLPRRTAGLAARPNALNWRRPTGTPVHELAGSTQGGTCAMSGKQQFYITTPIFYPNGAPHIGHAYTALASDAIARFERLDNKDVFFLTGTDEHGLKMKQTAIAEGLTPQALADRNSQRFRDMMLALNISQDDFIRTTEPRHYRASEEIWRRMQAAGDIYLDTYAGWYSVRQEAYFDEKETTLGADGVRREPLGSPVEWTEEETYFFRLSAFAGRLLEHYDKHADF